MRGDRIPPPRPGPPQKTKMPGLDRIKKLYLLNLDSAVKCFFFFPAGFSLESWGISQVIFTRIMGRVLVVVCFHDYSGVRHLMGSWAPSWKKFRLNETHNVVSNGCPKSKCVLFRFCFKFRALKQCVFRRYGDKTPKSTTARVFSVGWILTGVTCMAIFVAHITSVLTSLKLNHGAETIVGKKVR